MWEPFVPLFEQERHLFGDALVADGPDPVRMHRPGARAGFAAGDDPVDAGQIQPGQRAEQRLAGQEPSYRRCRLQLVDAVQRPGILHRRAEHDIR
jgi:hypothetical protein